MTTPTIPHYWPNITYEKHVIDIKKNFDVEVKSDVYLDWDVDVEVNKHYNVKVDTDLEKLEGNVAALEWEFEAFFVADGFQAVTDVDVGQSSLSQFLVEKGDAQFAAIASATSDTTHYPVQTFTEIALVAVIDEYAGTNISGSMIAAVDFDYAVA
jgi:hypothetical protein